MNKKEIIEIIVKALGFYLLVLAVINLVAVISGAVSILTEMAFQASSSSAGAQATIRSMMKFKVTSVLGNLVALFIYFHFAHYFIFIGPKLRRLIEIGCADSANQRMHSIADRSE